MEHWLTITAVAVGAIIVGQLESIRTTLKAMHFMMLKDFDERHPDDD